MRRHPATPFLRGMPTEPALDPGRRRVLKLMAASAALAGTGCTQPPPEKIMPYVNMPEGLAPGDPVFYASTLLRDGYGIGVLVETESGRPIKIEGNTAHPASLGAADAQAQAAILTLWDPERSRTVMHKQQVSTWEALFSALDQGLREKTRPDGAGLRLLTGPVSSPTLLSQIAEVLARFPGAQWHMHDAADSGTRAAAARQVFGLPSRCVYRFDRARVVLSVDAELFGPSADGVRNAHDFMAARRQTPRARMYALESSPNLCGALADSRIALAPADMEAMLETMAAGLAGNKALPPKPAWMNKLYAQLRAARGACVVAPGHSLSLRAHLLAWRLNALLGNIGKTVFAQEHPALHNTGNPADPGAQYNGPAHPSGLIELANAMRDDKVGMLIMLDVNPVYDAPGMLCFSTALDRVPCSVHMGQYRDETARRATWHAPMTHELEAWSDARGHDGTPSIVQPVIAPIYGGRSAHELMSFLASGQFINAHQRVRATWRAQWRENDDAAFERRWHAALSRGVIDDGPALSALTPVSTAFDILDSSERTQANASPDDAKLIAVFANDSNLVAGSYANNAWLQELPRPYTKITWDNAALLSPATARQHSQQSGNIVALTADGAAARVLAPVWVLPGQADGVVTLALGYGRPHAGSTALGHGFDAYILQDVRNGIAQRTRTVTLTATGLQHEFACTQRETSPHGRAPVRVIEIRRNTGGPDAAKPGVTTAGPGATRVPGREKELPAPSLYSAREYNSYAWGMTVDLDACIGCNACAIACQAENNIPVVGPEQVAMGREMHWIRIDLYREETGNRTQFQPMACQHCENAPCEVVCPVGATMHDSEGLNVQVYNRCVGTRFCSNNCPYKVRHFNFFQFSQSDPSAAAHANPDVTVRQRGVMEKCTYCLQRISHARIQAQKAGRAIQDGEVVTACQATCPTNAIVFGDTRDPGSRVSRSKAVARNYAVLEDLNTKPRTTYLARIDDPAAHLGDDND